MLHNLFNNPVGRTLNVLLTGLVAWVLIDRLAVDSAVAVAALVAVGLVALEAVVLPVLGLQERRGTALGVAVATLVVVLAAGWVGWTFAVGPVVVIAVAALVAVLVAPEDPSEDVRGGLAFITGFVVLAAVAALAGLSVRLDVEVPEVFQVVLAVVVAVPVVTHLVRVLGVVDTTRLTLLLVGVATLVLLLTPVAAGLAALVVVTLFGTVTVLTMVDAKVFARS